MLGWFPPDPPLPLSPPFSDLPLSRTCWLWSLLLSECWFWFWLWLWFDPVPLSVSCTEDGLGCPVLFPLSMFESSLAIWLRLSLRKLSRIVNLESAEVVVFPSPFEPDLLDVPATFCELLPRESCCFSISFPLASPCPSYKMLGHKYRERLDRQVTDIYTLSVVLLAAASVSFCFSFLCVWQGWNKTST